MPLREGVIISLSTTNFLFLLWLGFVRVEVELIGGRVRELRGVTSSVPLQISDGSDCQRKSE